MTKSADTSEITEVTHFTGVTIDNNDTELYFNRKITRVTYHFAE